MYTTCCRPDFSQTELFVIVVHGDCILLARQKGYPDHQYAPLQGEITQYTGRSEVAGSPVYLVKGAGYLRV